MEERQVLIIGAGVAGLIAAYHCEQAKLRPLIVDAKTQVGGRVQTTEKNGFLLDKFIGKLMFNLLTIRLENLCLQRMCARKVSIFSSIYNFCEFLT